MDKKDIDYIVEARNKALISEGRVIFHNMSMHDKSAIRAYMDHLDNIAQILKDVVYKKDKSIKEG